MSSGAHRPTFDRVEAREVSKIYERHRALYRVSLTLAPGRVVGLMGPNGSGKTTLLNLFSTLSQPTSGSMHFGALKPERAREARGSIGLLSHHALTYGDLSGLENVVFFGRLYRSHFGAAVVPEAQDLLAEFGLKDAMHRPAKSYSRGMLQRLSLARALIGRPSLVLLDEPFTGLDSQSTVRVIESVQRLRNQGAMVLMISHDITTTAELVDETVILLRGRNAGRTEGRLSREELASAYARVVEGADK